MPCAFCEIAARRAPADLVYDDGEVLAFLPLEPQSRAHVLVAPRRHVEGLFDAEGPLVNEVMAVVRTLALRMRSRLGATGVNVLHATGPDAQQSVPHLHVHVLARFANDGLDAWPALPICALDRAALVTRPSLMDGE